MKQIKVYILLLSSSMLTNSERPTVTLVLVLGSTCCWHHISKYQWWMETECETLPDSDVTSLLVQISILGDIWVFCNWFLHFGHKGLFSFKLMWSHIALGDCNARTGQGIISVFCSRLDSHDLVSHVKVLLQICKYIKSENKG